MACERLVLSVDRLDYTKGLIERVEAIRSLISRLPQCRGIVTFMQVAVPTRIDVPEYQQYRLRLETAVNALNAEFGHGDWKPLIYRTERMTRRELVAHYRAADIACVTPTADGMNVVASEYCASRTDGDGVLVLSSQSGASTTLGEFAVSVDTGRQESVVTGILQALTMSEAERTYRMGRLRKIVLKNTTGVWLRNCLNDIVQPDPLDAEQLAVFAQSGQLRRPGKGRIHAGKSRHAGQSHSSGAGAKRKPADSVNPHAH
jgi:trehalose-6-phosphate synthase